MSLLFVKIVLAPLCIALVSLVSGRAGPRVAGLVLGLPTTALPFMLTMYLTHGTQAAITTAGGGIVGQLVCALFCIAYARTAPRMRPLTATLAAITAAAGAGLTTLVLGMPLLVAAVALAACVVGLATWPTGSVATRGPREPAWSIPVRMGLVAVVVIGLAALEPHVGTLLAGALASLPTILMVMTPTMHWAQGPRAAMHLAHGTLGSIAATIAYLVVIVAAAPLLGLWPALGLGLLALLPAQRATTLAAARLRHGIHARRHRLAPPTPVLLAHGATAGALDMRTPAC